jgi:UDP-2,3-diacylglucosamine pyrophosphatase LpxH
MLNKLKFRSIFISDVHLGSRACKAEYLLDFLHNTECEHLYLVGDIIDLWAMKKSWHWPPTHNNVIRKILSKARSGTRVTYIPGNHDELFRDFIGHPFGAIPIERQVIHETADNRRFLVLHGDEFDDMVRYNRWIARIGSRAYKILMVLNRWVHAVRRRLGLGYWSFADYLKSRVKNAVNYVERFEHAVALEAHRRGVDGLICGHIHKAAIYRIGDIHYCNDGDWVESCTALVEHHDGRFAIIRWVEESVYLLEEDKAPGLYPEVA